MKKIPTKQALMSANHTAMFYDLLDVFKKHAEKMLTDLDIIQAIAVIGTAVGYLITACREVHPDITPELAKETIVDNIELGHIFSAKDHTTKGGSA